jgi:hypothetical protein
MQLSEVVDVLVRKGFTDQEIDDVRLDLYDKYPKLEADAFSHAMSTNPHDPEVPLPWLHKLLQGSRPPVYLNPAAGLVEKGPEREQLAAKALELLPAPREITDETKAAYEKKTNRVRQLILETPNLGFTLVHGNTKIGAIDNFSLPAGQNFRGAACPGASELCESLCYAKDRLFEMNEWRYYTNWAYVILWPDRFIDAFKKAKLTKVFRIHVGGDFFHPNYVKIWREVIDSRKDIRFYAYTRSWQNGKGTLRDEFLPGLRELSYMDNMRLILSCDRETGIPKQDLVSKAFRAYLAVNDADMPKEPVELLFRDHDGMQAVAGEMGGTPVCPVERSKEYVKVTGKITCQNCGWCWSTGHMAFGKRPDEPSQFNKYARVDVVQRAGMFRGFWPAPGAAVKNPSRGKQACICDADARCGRCSRCVHCLCNC